MSQILTDLAKKAEIRSGLFSIFFENWLIGAGSFLALGNVEFVPCGLRGDLAKMPKFEPRMDS
jgi:hypothetical protein